MKKLLFCLLTLFLNLSIPAQKKVEEQFKKAIEFYQDKEYDSALLIFQKIYDGNKGDETLHAKAFYNTGDIYWQKQDYENAKEVFVTILLSDFDEMDKGGRGEGIMAEPYALYKNNSSKMLTAIALIEKNYQKALEYTELFDKVYPYQHFCGNEYAANDIYVAYTYARCFEGLGRKDEAISVMLPQCMDNGLADNDYLLELACRLIKEQYSKEQIKSELEKAVSGISRKTKGTGKSKYEYYYVTVFESEIRLSGFAGDWLTEMNQNDLTAKDRYIISFTKSNFYKMLMK